MQLTPWDATAGPYRGWRRGRATSSPNRATGNGRDISKPDSGRAVRSGRASKGAAAAPVAASLGDDVDAETRRFQVPCLAWLAAAALAKPSEVLLQAAEPRRSAASASSADDGATCVAAAGDGSLTGTRRDVTDPYAGQEARDFGRAFVSPTLPAQGTESDRGGGGIAPNGGVFAGRAATGASARGQAQTDAGTVDAISGQSGAGFAPIIAESSNAGFGWSQGLPDDVPSALPEQEGSALPVPRMRRLPPVRLEGLQAESVSGHVSVKAESARGERRLEPIAAPAPRPMTSSVGVRGEVGEYGSAADSAASSGAQGRLRPIQRTAAGGGMAETRSDAAASRPMTGLEKRLSRRRQRRSSSRQSRTAVGGAASERGADASDSVGLAASHRGGVRGGATAMGAAAVASCNRSSNGLHCSVPQWVLLRLQRLRGVFRRQVCHVWRALAEQGVDLDAERAGRVGDGRVMGPGLWSGSGCSRAVRSLLAELSAIGTPESIASPPFASEGLTHFVALPDLLPPPAPPKSAASSAASSRAASRRGSAAELDFSALTGASDRIPGGGIAMAVTEVPIPKPPAAYPLRARWQQPLHRDAGGRDLPPAEPRNEAGGLKLSDSPAGAMAVAGAGAGAGASGAGADGAGANGACSDGAGDTAAGGDSDVGLGPGGWRVCAESLQGPAGCPLTWSGLQRRFGGGMGWSIVRDSLPAAAAMVSRARAVAAEVTEDRYADGATDAAAAAAAADAEISAVPGIRAIQVLVDRLETRIRAATWASDPRLRLPERRPAVPGMPVAADAVDQLAALRTLDTGYAVDSPAHAPAAAAPSPSPSHSPAPAPAPALAAAGGRDPSAGPAPGGRTAEQSAEDERSPQSRSVLGPWRALRRLWLRGAALTSLDAHFVALLALQHGPQGTRNSVALQEADVAVTGSAKRLADATNSALTPPCGRADVAGETAAAAADGAPGSAGSDRRSQPQPPLRPAVPCCEELDLGCAHRLGGSTAKLLCPTVFALSRGLRSVDVSYCPLRDEGLKWLCSALHGSVSLTRLRMAGCGLGPQSASSIVSLATSCPALQALALPFNALRAPGLATLAQLIGGRRESGALNGSRSSRRSRIRSSRHAPRRLPTPGQPAAAAAAATHVSGGDAHRGVDRGTGRWASSGSATSTSRPPASPIDVHGRGEHAAPTDGLAAEPHPNLVEWDLRSTSLGPAGGAVLAAAIVSRGRATSKHGSRVLPLRALNVADNHLTPPVAAGIASSLRRAFGWRTAATLACVVPSFPSGLESLFSERLLGESAIVGGFASLSESSFLMQGSAGHARATRLLALQRSRAQKHDELMSHDGRDAASRLGHRRADGAAASEAKRTDDDGGAEFDVALRAWNGRSSVAASRRPSLVSLESDLAFDQSTAGESGGGRDGKNAPHPEGGFTGRSGEWFEGEEAERSVGLLEGFASVEVPPDGDEALPAPDWIRARFPAQHRGSDAAGARVLLDGPEGRARLLLVAGGSDEGQNDGE